jgi:hypothetical protein
MYISKYLTVKHLYKCTYHVLPVSILGQERLKLEVCFTTRKTRSGVIRSKCGLSELDNWLFSGDSDQVQMSNSQTVCAREVQTPTSHALCVGLTVICCGRSPHILRAALRDHHELLPFYEELRKGDGYPGAKLVCRPDHRKRVIRFLTVAGALVQNETLTLSQMKPRHIIVAHEFEARVNRIIASLPYSQKIRAQRIADVRVPLVEVKQTTPNTIVESLVWRWMRRIFARRWMRCVLRIGGGLTPVVQVGDTHAHRLYN